MNILHILTMHQPAGLENRAFRFICSADTHTHAVVVVSKPIHRKFKHGFSDEVKIKHWKYAGPFKLPRWLRTVFLKNWLKKNKFDVFISYSQLSYPNLWNTIFENTEAKGIYWEGGAAWYKPEKLKKLLERFNGYIAISKASAKMLENKFGIKNEKITVIHNGLPEKKFQVVNSAKAVDCKHSKFIILFMGRLVAVKGVESLIRAMKHLDGTCELWIIGNGEQKNSLRNLAEREGVEKQILFKGFQVDTEPFLKAADIMVVPSLREPLGNVILEAGAAGLAVIASRVDGIPDVISPGENGILLDPRIKAEEISGRECKKLPRLVVDMKSNSLVPPRYIDPEELARAIEKLKNNPQLRRRLGKNLYKTVRENFLMEDKIKKFEEYIETIL